MLYMPITYCYSPIIFLCKADLSRDFEYVVLCAPQSTVNSRIVVLCAPNSVANSRIFVLSAPKTAAMTSLGKRTRDPLHSHYVENSRKYFFVISGRLLHITIRPQMFVCM